MRFIQYVAAPNYGRVLFFVLHFFKYYVLERHMILSPEIFLQLWSMFLIREHLDMPPLTRGHLHLLFDVLVAYPGSRFSLW